MIDEEKSNIYFGNIKWQFLLTMLDEIINLVRDTISSTFCGYDMEMNTQQTK